MEKITQEILSFLERILRQAPWVQSYLPVILIGTFFLWWTVFGKNHQKGEAKKLQERKIALELLQKTLENRDRKFSILNEKSLELKFKDRDHNFYTAVSEQLINLGYKVLGNAEDTEVNLAWPSTASFYRYFLSQDSRTLATAKDGTPNFITEMNPGYMKALLIKLMLKFIKAPKFLELRFFTAFSDNHFVESPQPLNPDAKSLENPKLSVKKTPENLEKEHHSRVNEAMKDYAKRNGGRIPKPLAFTDLKSVLDWEYKLRKLEPK